MANERSPRFPGDNIQESVRRLELLYAEAGRAAVTSETAALAIGYKGLNGASRTSLASLSYYGFLQREGDTHRISESGLHIIRPLNDADRLENLRIAAFRPAIFTEIREKHGDCSETVLSRILLREGFTEDGAVRAARIYKENLSFLGGDSDSSTLENQASVTQLALIPSPSEEMPAPDRRSSEISSIKTTGKMLAQYQIPLGANEATLVFTGDQLVPEDFDALLDYVTLFKRQFVRKLKATPEIVTVPPTRQIVDDFITQHGRPPVKSEYAE